MRKESKEASVSFADLSEDERTLLRWINSINQLARDGYFHEAFVELTTRSDLDEIRSAAESARKWALEKYKAVHPEDHRADSPEITAFMSIIITALARNYVGGLLERKLSAQKYSGYRLVNTGCSHFDTCDECTFPDCRATATDILRHDAKKPVRRTMP
ncbi:hypothetical protein [Anaerotruncus rubiinfantis]|uniref:hypothetical protein n=1 Tax=Anaerotruncus rubiinfantis TaxID=1720200 RepID=UPI003D7BAE86